MGLAIQWIDKRGNKRSLLELFAHDGVFAAPVTVGSSHHEIHEQDTYTILDVVDLSINNVRDLQITVPASAKRPHFTFSLDSENETEWFLYRGVTIGTPGAEQLTINSDHNCLDSAGLDIKFIDATSVANANSDTDVTGATEIYHGKVGAGRDAGNHDHSNELLLKTDTIYALRIIATVAGYVNYHLDWYEHVADKVLGEE